MVCCFAAVGAGLTLFDIVGALADATFCCDAFTGDAFWIVLRLSASATIDCVISTGSTGVGARVGFVARTVLLSERDLSASLIGAASVGS